MRVYKFCTGNCVSVVCLVTGLVTWWSVSREGGDNVVGVFSMPLFVHGGVIIVFLHRHVWSCQCMTTSNVAAHYSCGLWCGRAGVIAASPQKQHERSSSIAAGAASAQE